MTEEINVPLDPAKEKELTDKLAALGNPVEWPVNLDEYELDPTFPRHLYERAKVIDKELAVEVFRTETVLAPVSKLAGEIESLENGAEQWRLASIHPIQGRPGKTNAGLNVLALFRTKSYARLPWPKKLVTADQVSPTDQASIDVLKKSEEWAKAQST